MEKMDVWSTEKDFGQVPANSLDSHSRISRNIFQVAGALGAMMSGSGPTVFGIFRDRRTAKEAFTKVKAQNLAKQIYLANVHNVRRR